ncbi:Zinc-binding dehydrogenase [Ceratobasidium sp. AG-Ba]|nr:Zinc-binding dehydrogenase [Ceratobasidium sp. AG-Ba]
MSTWKRITKVAQVQEVGGVEQIEVVELPIPVPQPDEVLIKVEWGGVNFIDILFRDGDYRRPTPYIMGEQGAGTITEDFEVRGFHKGARAVTFGCGCCAEYVAVHWKDVFVVPNGVSTRIAAATMTQELKALTAVRDAYRVEKGDTVLVHTAADGVGMLLRQLARNRGATVIGTTSSEAKARRARAAGPSHVILYTKDSIPRTVLKITNGQGGQGIYGGIGAATWNGNLEVIAIMGTIVSLGDASGPVPPVNLHTLAEKNVKVCYPALKNYLPNPKRFQNYCTELFEYVRTGQLKIEIFAESVYYYGNSPKSSRYRVSKDFREVVGQDWVINCRC